VSVANEIFKLTGRGEWYGELSGYATKPNVEIIVEDDGTLAMHMVGKIDKFQVEEVRRFLCRAAKQEAKPGTSFVTRYRAEDGEEIEETWPPRQPIAGN
jgi:hypothetical protein